MLNICSSARARCLSRPPSISEDAPIRVNGVEVVGFQRKVARRRSSAAEVPGLGASDGWFPPVIAVGHAATQT
jgi:hypothetical protein